MLDGRYLGIAIPYETHEILEIPPTFEEFLKNLGPNNRRHMKGRQCRALKAGLKFTFTADAGAVDREERYQLGLQSRPCEYSKETIDAWDAYAQNQPGFFHCMLRDANGKLLSYSPAFSEQDSAVMMYQLNDANYPDLGLTMTLRGFMIQHLAESGIRRLVLPMGISGHLQHAATTNTVTQVLFVRRSLPSVAKALLLGYRTPDSSQATMVGTPGFAAHFLTGR